MKRLYATPEIGAEISVRPRAGAVLRRKLVGVDSADDGTILALILEDRDNGPNAVIAVPWHEITSIQYDVPAEEG